MTAAGILISVDICNASLVLVQEEEAGRSVRSELHVQILERRGKQDWRRHVSVRERSRENRRVCEHRIQLAPKVRKGNL